MTIGDHVVISGARGNDVGIVRDVIRVEDMPQLPGYDIPMPLLRNIVRELGVDHMAFVEHRLDTPKPHVFALLHVRATDEWRDLRGAVISVATVMGRG